MMNQDSRNDAPPGFWRTRFALGWVVLVAVGGWFLWTEHRAHLLGALPYLLLLSCPLMHVFMHHGHDPHHRGAAPEGKPPKGDNGGQP